MDAYDSDQSFSDISDDDSVKNKDYTQPSLHLESDEESEIPSPRKQRHDMVQQLSSHVRRVFALESEDEVLESTAGAMCASTPPLDHRNVATPGTGVMSGCVSSVASRCYTPT